MIDTIIKDIEQYRYERKFFVNSYSYDELLFSIKKHPFCFKEIYHERKVNSVYFDTFDRKHLLEGVNGLASRLKVRIRWYNELFGNIKKPTIEFKYKRNDLIGKLLYGMKPFSLDHQFSSQQLQRILKESALKEYVYEFLRALVPSAVTSYQRRYFLSFDRKFRITVDGDLSTYKFSSHRNQFLNQEKFDHHVIVELKYDRPWDKEASLISNEFLFRITKSSKYSMACGAHAA